jgi:hypothetical protein
MATPDQDALTFTVATVWREDRVSCPHPDILTAFLTGGLDADASEFVRFHLEESQCPFCNSVCDDLAAKEERDAEVDLEGMRERLLRSTVVALRKTPRG